MTQVPPNQSDPEAWAQYQRQVAEYAKAVANTPAPESVPQTQAWPEPLKNTGWTAVRTTLMAFLVALGLCAFSTILWIIGGELGEIGARFFISSLSLAAFTGGALIGAALIDSKTWYVLGMGTVASAVFCLVLTMIAIWMPLGEGTWRLIWMICVITVATLHIVGLRLIAGHHHPMTLVTFKATAALIVMVASILIITVFSIDGDLPSSFWRMLAVLAVLDICGTCAVPVVRLVEKPSNALIS